MCVQEYEFLSEGRNAARNQSNCTPCSNYSEERFMGSVFCVEAVLASNTIDFSQMFTLAKIILCNLRKFLNFTSHWIIA